MKYYFLNFGRFLLFPVFLIFLFIAAVTEVSAQCPDASGVQVDFSVITCNGADDGTVTLTITNANGYAGQYTYSLFRNPETGIPPGLFTHTTTDLTWTFTDLIPATYSIIITPEAPCANVFPGDVILTQPEPLVATLDGITPACSPGTGGIDLSVTGGNGNYSYVWTGPTDPGNTQDPSGIDAGTYTVTVSDDKNCSVTIPDIFVPVITEADAGTDQVVCTPNATLNGNAYRNPGESGMWTLISGSGSVTDPTDPNSAVVNLGEGDNVFEWFITDDASFCPGTTDRVTIAWHNLQLVSPGDILLNCNGVTNAAGSFTPSGGTAPFTFTVDNNTTGATTSSTATSLDFSGAGVGNLTVTVTDATNCSATETIAISEPPAIVVDSATKTDATCDGGSDGSVTVTASGGSGSLTFTLMPDGISNSTGFFSGLDAGNYTVDVFDANGCGPVSSSTLTIGSPAPIVIDNSSSTNLTCNGGNDGSITLVASGGTGQLSYTLQPLGITTTTGVFTGLTAGSYTVEITDANACGPLVTPPIVITQPAGVAIDNIVSTNVTCNGNNDGTITITASGGVTPYNFTLSPGGITNTTGVFNNLAPGTYQVDVNEGNGCGPVNTGDITITEPPVLTIGAPAGTDITCNGLADGSINVSASGGSGTFTYTLQPAGIVNTSGNFTGIPAGTYTIDVQDDNSCVASTASITLNEPSAISIDGSSNTNVTCNGGNDGSLQVTASGGTGALTFTLQPGGLSNATGLFGNLIAGVYTVEVTDGNSCGPVTTSTISITEPSLDLAVTDASVCNPATGDVVITVSGTTAGIEYELQSLGGASLSPPVSAISSGGDLDLVIAQANVPAATTTYQIEVHAPGCSNQILTDQPVVNVLPGPSPALAVSDATVCSGSTSDVSFVITGSENNVSYELQLSDGSSLTPAVTATGNGGDLSLTISAANVPAVSTTYRVAASVASGCSTVLADQPVLTVSPQPNATITGDATSCPADNVDLTLTLTGTGPWNVTYNDGSGDQTITANASPFTLTVAPVATTTYSLVSVEDVASACTNSTLASSATVTVSPITGDQVTYGSGAWIGYVYDDMQDGRPYPSRVDFDPAKYRGFINQPDNFDLGLDTAPLSSPDLCRDYGDFYSIRFKQTKTFTSGTYEITVGGDDGFRLSLDGGSTFVIDQFVDQSYTSRTITLCLDGTYDMVLEYYEHTGESRVSYNAVMLAPADVITTSITADQLPVCQGSPVTFTSTVINGGATPVYQWQVNGVDLPGENGNTYSSSTLNDGDIVRLIVTPDPSASCISGSPATSNELTFSSVTSLTASVSITADQNPTCTGNNIVFKATTVNAGADPTYQWQVNGVDVAGETDAIFTGSGLSDGDVIHVILTPDPLLGCLTNSTAVSNDIAATFVTDLTASVAISADQDPVCDGTTVTYTANVTDAGANPTFQWRVNGTAVAGEVTRVFSSSTLDNGDVVDVIVTADPAFSCISNSPVTSNVLAVNELPSGTVSVNLTVDQNPVCAGDTISFNAAVTNGGPAPTYQWQVNGADLSGETSSDLLIASLADGDQVRVVVTADPAAGCVTNSPVTSSAITMNVTSTLTPVVTITADQNPVCSGDVITFSSNVTDAGANPAYQWRVNGIFVTGETGATYTGTGLADGDNVDLLVNVDPAVLCATQATVTSNIIPVSIVNDLTASATIFAGQNPVCIGSASQFTISTNGAGAKPTYQWQVNGSPVAGETGDTFSAILNDGDVVNAIVTADPAASCVSNSPLASNNVTIETSADLDASVSITADQNPVCSGNAITFSASVSQAGAAPSLQWQVNGAAVPGENGLTFTSSSLSDGDQVTAVLTADPAATCVSNSPVTSNAIDVSIVTGLTASVVITADQNPVCAGDMITFNAAASDAGANPAYQWRVNGTDISGATSPTFASSALSSGDQVTVVVTADPAATCVTNSPVVSNAIAVSVVTSLTPVVSISADQNPVCVGDVITWSSTVSGAGANPAYQWEVNGTPVAGATSDSFSSPGLADGDQVALTVTADPAATCVTTATVTSTPETVNIVTSLTPSVSIAASQTTLCAGQSVSFTSNVTNGGANPSFQWQINGSPVVGATNATLTIASFSNGDQVNVVVTADPALSCATTGPVSSNVINMTVRPVGDPACTGGGENCGAFVVEVTPTRPPCNAPDAGAISFKISGGSGNYTVVLSDNDSFNQGEAGLAGTPIVFEDLTAADYQYTITDSNGTTCTLPFTLDNETILEAAVLDVTPSACYNEPEGSVTIEILSGGNPPYEYSLDGVLWNQSTTSQFTVTGLSPQDSPVGILIRDDFSDVCPEEVMVTIDNLYPEITVPVTTVPVSSCDGNEGEVTVEFPPAGGNSPNGIWSISLVPGTAPAGTMTTFAETRTFNGLTAGEYSLYLQDEGGCQKVIPVTVASPNQVNLEALVVDADCDNEGKSGGLLLQVTNTLQVPGPYDLVITAENGAQAGEMIYGNATWSGNLLEFDTLISATYSIRVTPSDQNLCPVEVERIITGGPQPVSFDYYLMCGSGTSNKELMLTDIQGNDGEAYTLQVFDNLTSALEEEITFTLNIGNQYLLQNYLFLTRIKEYKLRLLQHPAVCGWAEIRYDHPENLLIPTILTAQIGETLKSYPDRPTGQLEVINFGGGFQPKDNAYPYLVAIQLDSAAIPGQSYSTDFDTVKLDKNLDFVIRYKNIPAGRYRVVIMDQMGCSRELVARIPLDTDLFIPNIFTPNGDDKNETFFIRNKPDADVRLLITNRWGKRVYESSDYQNDWSGEGIADGIYYYLIDTGDQVYKGWVEVLRGSNP